MDTVSRRVKPDEGDGGDRQRQDPLRSGKHECSATEDKMVDMKKQLTLFNGISITMGLVIGLSVFLSPAGVIRGTGSGGLALIVWVLCGLMSLVGALVFAEISTTFPQSGSMYVYLNEFFGPYPSFVYLIEYFIFLRPSANAVKCLTFASYAVRPIFSHCEAPPIAVSLIAILMACVITFVNLYDVKISARLQNCFVLCTVSSLLLIIGAGIYYAALGKELHLSNMFENTNNDPGDIALAFYSGFFAFGGWEALTFMVEEVKEPERNLPRAICVSLVLIIILYVCVNVSYQSVLGAEGILSSVAVGSTMLEKVMSHGSTIMACLISINMTSSFNSGTLVSSRLGFVSGRRGHLPTLFSLLHVQHRTPIGSLLLQLVLVIFFCAIGNVFFILNNMVFAHSFFLTCTIAGLIRHRKQNPTYRRPFRMPMIVLVIYFICNIFLLIVPLVTKPLSCAIGIAIIVCTATPYYILFIIKPCKTKLLDTYSNNLLVFLQKLLFATKPQSV